MISFTHKPAADKARKLSPSMRMTSRPFAIQRKQGCSCGGGCPACQAKSDRFEHEAEKAANQIMRRSRSPSLSKADEEPMKNEQQAGETIPEHLRSALSGGDPLPQELTNFFSNGFGYDFSAVRLHREGTAQTSAKELGARAYTYGRHIAFAPGEYAPNSHDGRHLIAHELAHVVQQGAVSIRENAQPQTTASEHTAQQPAPRINIKQQTSPAIQRDCADDKRKCRNAFNWSDGGHWQGVGSEPDCNCDSSFSDAQSACGSRLNWSDGGHWIGTGSEPDCSLVSTGQSRFTLNFYFPSNECVQKFNSGRSHISTRLSTMTGVAVGIAAAPVAIPIASSLATGTGATGAATGVGAATGAGAASAATAARINAAVGIAAGAAMNELVGALPQTTIGVGYRWTREMMVQYERSAHPWGVNSLTLEIISSVFNENNEIVDGYAYFHEFTPEAIVRLGPLFAAGQPDEIISVNCPTADVLSM